MKSYERYDKIYLKNLLKYFFAFFLQNIIKGPLQSREVKQVTTIDFYFYLLFENTFYDFVRRAPFIHTFLILIKIFRIFPYELTEKSEKYEKTPKRKSVFRISYFSPSIRNGIF